MTVQELYEYAFNNLLLDEDVNNVIKKYHQSKSISTYIPPSNDYLVWFGGKVEYSYEDVIELFNS